MPYDPTLTTLVVEDIAAKRVVDPALSSTQAFKALIEEARTAYPGPDAPINDAMFQLLTAP